MGGTEWNQLTQMDFNWFEYSVFWGMIAGSAAIGIYFGYCKKADNTVAEYMLGGKKMPVVPVALSLIAGFVSGITLLGYPAEVYLFGTQMILNMVGACIGAVINLVFYLPVLYNLQSASIYEYLELRFNKTVRKIGSGVFALSLLTYIPVVIYVPSLAFNQVTGVPMEILAPIICTVCLFYTVLGGLKAVVWSDALQAFFTMAACFIVCILGVNSAGGFAKVWDVNVKGERIEFFNMDPDPFQRNTFWTVLLGSIINWTGMIAIHPASYQRFISVRTYTMAQVISVIMCVGLIVIKSVSLYTGLVIYARYKDCDPVEAKVIDKLGQIFPYYVMDVAHDYPGLTGLFLSGVVSTALSTMSMCLNTIAGTLFEDFVRPRLSKNIKDVQANRIIKVNVVILGAICTGLVFVVQYLGTILQLAFSLVGITKGTTLFIFTAGMAMPWLKSRGVLLGALASIGVTSFVTIGAQLAIANKSLRFPGKVTSIAGCHPNITAGLDYNTTTFGYPGVGTPVINDGVPLIFQISYLYYGVIGLVTGFVVAILYTLLWDREDLENVDPKLIFPQMRWVLPKTRPEKDQNGRKIYNLVPINECQNPKEKLDSDQFAPS
uniref:Sodium-coupled monocarboxylate transporter 1 n=2 Tax=Lygus hesperus TaxID=30085 RepID=A0A146KPI9_LYGHE